MSHTYISHWSTQQPIAIVVDSLNVLLVLQEISQCYTGDCYWSWVLSFILLNSGGFDLGGQNMPVHELVVNWRPCAMCYGAVLWSGVKSLVIAGNGPELEEITGFDEGPLLSEWKEELQKRGIAVTVDVGREDAIKVFEAFRESGNKVYNGRGGAAEE